METGDSISTGDVTGQAIAIGHGARAVYQAILRPLPVDPRALVQPLIEAYTAIFGGRDAELNRLDAFLADERHPFGLLVAPTGLGKTALLVHWIRRVQQRTDNRWQIIFVPVSIRYQTAGEQVALRMLAHSLAEFHHDLEQFRQYEQSPAGLRALVIAYLRRPLPDGSRLLLVLDGIDEAVGWQVGPLCAVPPQVGLKIVVAARQRADMGHTEWTAHLNWDAGQVAHFHLTGLDRAALIALLKAQDERLAALADDPAFVAQFERVSEGDPLTCNLLIKALLGNTLSPTDLSRRPPGLEAFLCDWVETLRKKRQESAAIRELLALCAVAYGPLTSDDLSALAPTVFSDQSAIVDAVRSDEVARFIITVGEHSYVFSHQRLREVFLERIYPPTERERLHRRMVDYGNAWWADRHQPLSEYLRRFWLLHCAEVGEWERIREVVSAIMPTRDGSGVEQPWQTARYAAEGSNSGYLGDLERLWTRAEQQGDLGLALRCALIAASLRGQSGNLSPTLLVGLVQVGTPAGTWSAATALEHIALMPYSKRQADSLQALLVAGIALPWARALEVALAIADKEARVTALAALAPHLPPHLLADALAAARTIADEYWRSRALAALAPHLPAEQQPAVYADALAAARTIANDDQRSRALAALAPHLPTHLFAEALAAARAIEWDFSRATALAALAPHLPAEQQPAVYADALATARTIADEYWRSRALAALAPHLPAEQQPAVYADALATARTIADEYRRSWALAALAPHLPPHLLAEALAAARTIRDADDQVAALAALAPHLPAEQQPAVYADALAAARTIADEYWRSRALAALAPHLPTHLFAEALAAARTIADDDQRSRALAALAPHLPTHLFAEALAAARAIEWDFSRATALAALAPHLPTGQQPAVYADALATARTIADEYWRSEALAALAPHLPAEQQPAVYADALATARTIADEYRRSRALAALAPHLPTHLFAEALAAARAIEWDFSRATALAALAPHLPAEQQPAVYADALAAARTIADDDQRSRALAALAPHLPTHLFAEALAAARAIEWDFSRATALAALAPHLPPHLLAEALAAARTIRDADDQVAALAALAPHLPPHLLAEALAAARTIRDADDQVAALAALAPHLPPHLLAEALAAARAIEWDFFSHQSAGGARPPPAPAPVRRGPRRRSGD
jgi:hypothetical protein